MKVVVSVLARKETRAEVLARKREERSDIKEDMAHEIEIARLNAELLKLKESPEFYAEKRAMAKLEDSFSEHDAHAMGVRKIEARERARHEEKYKNNPAMLQMANESLEAWMRKELD